MNKVQKIREEVEKRYEYWKEKEFNFHSIESEIRMSECQHLLLILDSLQEEPNYCCGECAKWVDGKGCSREKQNTHCITDAACKEGVKKGGKQKPVSEPNKELAETYLAVFDKKFPILPSLKGKQLADYKNFLNKCQQIFGLKEWGIHPIQSKLFEKLTLLWAAWGAKHLQGVGRQDEEEQDIPVNENLEEAANTYVDNWYKLNNIDKESYPIDVEISKNDFKAGAKWHKEQTMKDAIDVVVGNEWGHPRYVLTQYDLEPLGIRSRDRVKIIVIKEE